MVDSSEKVLNSLRYNISRNMRERKKVIEIRNKNINGIEDKADYFRESWYGKVLIYIGCLFFYSWLMGNVFAFFYYQGIGLDYFTLSTNNDGIQFVYEDSVFYVFSLIISAIFYLILLTFLENFMVFYKFIRNKLVKGKIKVNKWIVKKINFFYKAYFSFMLHIDIRTYGKDVIFILSLVMFAFFQWESINSNRDLLGMRKNTRYLVEVTEGKFECLRRVGTLGDYQVYLGRDGKGRPISTEVNPRIIMCPINENGTNKKKPPK